MIYFLCGVVSGLWKVGCSTLVVLRASQIVSQWREAVVIEAAIPGGFADENAMHARLSPLRDGRRGREWYADDGTIAAIVASIPVEFRGGMTIRPWSGKGGKDRLPTPRPAWHAEAMREIVAGCIAKRAVRRAVAA